MNMSTPKWKNDGLKVVEPKRGHNVTGDVRHPLTKKVSRETSNDFARRR